MELSSWAECTLFLPTHHHVIESQWNHYIRSSLAQYSKFLAYNVIAVAYWKVYLSSFELLSHLSQKLVQPIGTISGFCVHWSMYLCLCKYYTVLVTLLLLISHFSRVRLCGTPQTAAHQAPPSLGFSRQDHWSGLPFPSPMHESEKWKWSRSVISDSLWPMYCSLPGSSIHGIFQARVLEWGAITFSPGYSRYTLIISFKTVNWLLPFYYFFKVVLAILFPLSFHKILD